MVPHVAILACALVSGTCHPSADRSVRSYAVRVTAPAGSTVALRAFGVAPGWLASFCTPRVCSPDHVRLRVSGGTAAIQLSYVHIDGRAAARAPHVAGSIVR